jgi:hypothetical protein
MMKIPVNFLFGALVAMVFWLPETAGAQDVEAPQEDVSIPVEVADAEDHASWQDELQMHLSGRVMENDTEYMLDVMFPVWHKNLSVDLRGTLLEDREQEFNAGLVFRQSSFSDRIVLGANLYGDFRWTERDHQYEQVGLGVEVLSRWVDARANYYYPLTDETVLDESVNSDVNRSGRTRTETTTTFRNFEEALEGYDAEAGFWLPYISRALPTAVFGGYYQFNSDWVDDGDFGGWKARIEMHLHPLLTLDAEWFEEDALNQSDYILGLRLRIPLGGEWLKTPHTAGPYNFTADARLDDMVYRDFRIRTLETGFVPVNSSVNQATIATPSEPEPVCREEFFVDPVTGTITVVTICE